MAVRRCAPPRPAFGSLRRQLGEAWLAEREDADREELEEEEREARRAAATKKEVLRLTGTASAPPAM